MSQSGNSIIGAQGMIKKIYFPRLVIPLAKSLVGIVDFAIAFMFLVVIMLFYNHPVSANLLYLPFFIAINIIASLAVGLWLSALTVRYRDFQHIIPFAVQFGLYITPYCLSFPATDRSCAGLGSPTDILSKSRCRSRGGFQVLHSRYIIYQLVRTCFFCVGNTTFCYWSFLLQKS